MDPTVGSIMAYSPCLNITQAEMTTIATTMNSKDEGPFLSNGIWISGKKYICLRAMLDDDPPLVYAKLQEAGACIVKTEYCVVIGIYSKGQTAGECNVVTEGLAKYLYEQGY